MNVGETGKGMEENLGRRVLLKVRRAKGERRLTIMNNSYCGLCMVAHLSPLDARLYFLAHFYSFSAHRMQKILG